MALRRLCLTNDSHLALSNVTQRLGSAHERASISSMGIYWRKPYLKMVCCLPIQLVKDDLGMKHRMERLIYVDLSYF